MAGKQKAPIMRYSVTAILAIAIVLSAFFALIDFKTPSPVMIYDDIGGFTLDGVLQSGEYSGNVVISFADGGVYEGGIQNGQFDGAGSYTSAGEFAFTGVFNEGAIISGELELYDGTVMLVHQREHGENSDNLREYTVTSATGDSYFGKIGILGQRGYGEFTSFDGKYKYAGEFLSGFPNGNGTVYCDGKIIYTGEFLNGRYNGYGKYTSPEGWELEGSFSNGSFYE